MGFSNDSHFRVLHVSNISMTATKEQIYQLFAFIGRIDEFKVYPSDNHPQLSNFHQKFAYIKFEDQKSVEVSQHLTNTVFIDRALVCIPSISDIIPDEETALKTGGPAWPGQRQLPPQVANQLQDMDDGTQMLLTSDPTLVALGLPPYPALSGNTDLSKIEEIRRTVYVGNIPKECEGDEIMQFFNDNIGEVMYLRMTSGADNLPCAYAYVEFTNQPSLPIALQNNDIEFKGRCLRIQHSRVAIIKPERKTADMALQEVEEAIRINQQPEKSTAISKLSQGLGIDRSFSPICRSSTPRRRRSRSAERRRRSRSRSRSRRRSRDRRSRSRGRRSRSRGRDLSKSRDRRIRRSRSKDRREKDRREKDRRDRRRSRSRSARRRDTKRERDRERDRKRDMDYEYDRRREKEREKEKEYSKRDSKSDRSKRESYERDRGRDKSRHELKDTGRDRSGKKPLRNSPRAEVKLQIEDGESMEIDPAVETEMRERLIEKVMSRSETSNLEDHEDVEESGSDTSADERSAKSKPQTSDDEEVSADVSRVERKSESSDSYSDE